MTAAEIIEKLDLRTLKDRSWFLQPSCALTGDGLWDGLKWLSNEIKERNKANSFFLL
jgi:hypothetical protein